MTTFSKKCLVSPSIEGLDRPFIALMRTDGYEVGEPHWQLRDNGRLLRNIQTPEGHVAYDSKPVLDMKHLSRWIHLATVYDSASARVTHFIDGENVGDSSIATEVFRRTNLAVQVRIMDSRTL